MELLRNINSGFLGKIVSRLKADIAQVIDTTFLEHASWFLLNDYSEGKKVVWLFNSNHELLVIVNGVIEKGRWESVSHSTTSIIVEVSGHAIFYNILYLSHEYLILQQDGTELYLGLAKQEKYSLRLDLDSFGDLTKLYVTDLKAELNARNSMAKHKTPDTSLDNSDKKAIRSSKD